jgi:hypothetical protein
VLDFIVRDKFNVASWWRDWSEKEEFKNRDYYNEWLIKEIGKIENLRGEQLVRFITTKGVFKYCYKIQVASCCK